MGRLPINKRTIATSYLVIACTLAVGPLILRFRRPPTIIIEAGANTEENTPEERYFIETPDTDDEIAPAAYVEENHDGPATQEDPMAERQPLIFVHVAGHVVKPGLYGIPSSSRVHHAIETAGGMTEKADRDAVNIALPVMDGQQVYIPEKAVANQYEKGGGTRIPEEDKVSSGVAYTPEGRLDVTAIVPLLPLIEESKATGLIDINSAGQAELETLPGIGPALAVRIIDHRASKGPFTSIEALMDVSGIGPAKFDSIKDKVVVR